MRTRVVDTVGKISFVLVTLVALSLLTDIGLARVRHAAAAATTSTARVAIPEPQATFAIAQAPYAYRFPYDAGSHPDYQTEWWYYTGHVRAADGHRYGYELTFFRFGLRPGQLSPAPGQSRWRGNQLYPAHFALTDIDGNRFDHFESFDRQALGMGSAASGTLNTKVGDWYVRDVPVRGVPADRQAMTMHASAELDGKALTFDALQTPEKPPAIHGSEGVSHKAGCRSCASHYYSYTRLHTTGVLAIGGSRVAIDGLSWMDHEFGSAQLESNQSGWDWFSIQLDDKRELMLYSLRQKDGSITPQSSGSLIDERGVVHHLTLDDFETTATGSWKSPHTNATYPSGWRVRVAKANVDITLTPALADQELASAIGGTYWEGAVDVRDSGGKNVGQGYVELTGYAGGISL